MTTYDVCKHCRKKLVYRDGIGWYHKSTVSVYCDESGASIAELSRKKDLAR